VLETDPGVIGVKRLLTDLLVELWVTFLGDPMHRLGMKLLQYSAGLLTRSGAVADLILRLWGKLGHGLT
jgi:hypothetical protein